MGGFECATQRRNDGRRLDLIESTGHARWARQDYEALKAHGIRTMRDGARWHLIEPRPGHYDWSSLDRLLDASRQAKIQVIWDLAHYGWPDHLDIWSQQFIDRFATFSALTACRILPNASDSGWFCAINEMSFWAWAGGEVRHFHPCGSGRGAELKRQLVMASCAAMRAIRAVRPLARFICAEPLIHVAAHEQDNMPEAEAYRMAQFQALDWLDEALRSDSSAGPLDVIGLNFYPQNQWFLDGEKIARGDHAYQPLSRMLEDVFKRYQRPLLIAETGAEAGDRADWFRYVTSEVIAAQARGVPIHGICLYPILDYPGWEDDRPCATGLLGMADPAGHRDVHDELAAELQRQGLKCPAPVGC